MKLSALGALSGTLSLIYLFTIAATIALVAKAFGAYARRCCSVTPTGSGSTSSPPHW